MNAWHTAALTGAAYAGKLPELNALLNPQPMDTRTHDDLAADFAELDDAALAMNQKRR